MNHDSQKFFLTSSSGETTAASCECWSKIRNYRPFTSSSRFRLPLVDLSSIQVFKAFRLNTGCHSFELCFVTNLKSSCRIWAAMRCLSLSRSPGADRAASASLRRRGLALALRREDFGLGQVHASARTWVQIIILSARRGCINGLGFFIKWNTSDGFPSLFSKDQSVQIPGRENLACCMQHCAACRPNVWVGRVPETFSLF